jgi:hypothetical protein
MRMGNSTACEQGATSVRGTGEQTLTPPRYTAAVTTPLAVRIERIDAALAGAEPASFERIPPGDWYLVATMAYREQQRRLRDQVVGTIDALMEAGGDVPNLVGWRYEWQSRHVRLFGPHGEQHDINAYDDDSAQIEDIRFAQNLKHTRPVWGFAERRLFRWCPHYLFVTDVGQWLREDGIFVPLVSGGHVFVLPEPLEARAAIVAADLERPDAEKRWRRALGDRDDAEQRATQAGWLTRWVRGDPRAGHVLPAVLDALGPERGLELVTEKLTANDYTAEKAIELLRERLDLPVCPEIAELLRHFDASKDHIGTAVAALEYVCERDPAPDVARDAFDKLVLQSLYVPTLALIALRFLPERALATVRQALRMPEQSWGVAAVLAQLDQRWCHRELLTAHEERRHPVLRAALKHCSDEAVRRKALAIRVPPQPSHPAKPDEVLTSEIEARSPFAFALKGRFLDDWDGSIPS